MCFYRMKIYQLWGPLSDFEKSLRGIWGAKTAADNLVKCIEDAESELVPGICDSQDSEVDMDVFFDRTVKPPKTTSLDPWSSRVEVHFSFNLNCFADWASSHTDNHYTDLCSWASDLEAHWSNIKILDIFVLFYFYSSCSKIYISICSVCSDWLWLHELDKCTCATKPQPHRDSTILLMLYFCCFSWISQGIVNIKPWSV